MKVNNCLIIFIQDHIVQHLDGCRHYYNKWLPQPLLEPYSSSTYSSDTDEPDDGNDDGDALVQDDEDELFRQATEIMKEREIQEYRDNMSSESANSSLDRLNMSPSHWI